MTTTNTNNQTALYIRRAELYDTERYIIDTFKKLNIGIVSKLDIVRRVSNTCQEYNGVLVTFSEWFDTPEANSILSQINAHAEASAKIIHEPMRQRYWIVNKHQEYHERPEQSQASAQMSNYSVADLQYIIEEMNRRLFRQDQELQMMRERQQEYEIEHMRLALTNEDLRCELKEKEDIILEQQDKMVCMAIDMARKENECATLMETVREDRSILQLIESQAQDMRLLLNGGYKPNTSKMTIEELID
jgi:hypothetical protein